MMPTGRRSNTGNIKYRAETDYELKTYLEALGDGAISGEVTKENYDSTLTNMSSAQWKAMKAYRKKYPQPNSQYGYWPVVVVQPGQLTYLVNHDGGLMSREFTRSRLSGMGGEQLKSTMSKEKKNVTQ